MRGITEDDCRDKLRHHLTFSEKHQNLAAEGERAIERIVRRTVIKLWNPWRDRSRSRDDSQSPPPSPSPARNNASRTRSPSPALPESVEGIPDDDWVLVPSSELIDIAVVLEAAALRIRSFVGVSDSLDV